MRTQKINGLLSEDGSSIALHRQTSLIAVGIQRNSTYIIGRTLRLGGVLGGQNFGIRLLEQVRSWVSFEF